MQTSRQVCNRILWGNSLNILFKPASLKTQSPQFLILTATFEYKGQFIGLLINL
ncbi:MAG TPA: hypothetical protein V6D13_12565 [Halomicronema sp.]